MNGGGNVSPGSTGMQMSGGGRSGGAGRNALGSEWCGDVAERAEHLQQSIPVGRQRAGRRREPAALFATSMLTEAAAGRPGRRKWAVTVTGSGRRAASIIARTAMLSR